MTTATVTRVQFASIALGQLFLSRYEIFAEDEDAVADNTAEGCNMTPEDVETMQQIGAFPHTFEAHPALWWHMLTLMEIAEEDAENNARNARPKSAERKDFTTARFQYQEIVHAIRTALEA